MLRAMRRAKRSGRPIAAVNGSTVTASAPPSPAANTATVERRMFTYGSRRVIMRHAVSAATIGRHRREAAGLLDARPQFADRAEFRDGEELVGIRREAEIDHAPRCIERDAAAFERAQIGDRTREREGKLLRLRAARHCG